MEYAVSTYGPVAVIIRLTMSTFGYYSSGVYYDYYCGSSNSLHAVLVVGYGSEDGRVCRSINTEICDSWFNLRITGWLKIAGEHIGVKMDT